MKKSAAFMVLAAALGFTSCGPSSPKANLQSDIDSLSYMMGVSNTQGLMDYAAARLGIDSAQVSNFVDGIIEGTNNSSEKERANIAGIQIGQQIIGEMFDAINGQLFNGDSINALKKEQFVKGFIDALNGKSSASVDEASTYVRTSAEAIQNDTVKTALGSKIDTLSYMMGVSNTQGLTVYATTRLGVDSVHVSDFIAGVQKGTKSINAKEKAHISGVQIGQQISNEEAFKAMNNQLFGENSEKSLSKNNFLAGFIDGVQNKNIISLEESTYYVRTKAEALQKEALASKYAEYKKENEDFLATNKAKDGIKTTESGLQYRIVKAGKGATPTKDSKVKVHYKGTLIDGTKFDSSYDRNEPAVFGVSQVIKGWTEALTLMPVGSKWELYIPQELAYGSADMGQIKPFSTLIFEVELLGIEK